MCIESFGKGKGKGVGNLKDVETMFGRRESEGKKKKMEGERVERRLRQVKRREMISLKCGPFL